MGAFIWPPFSRGRGKRTRCRPTNVSSDDVSFFKGYPTPISSPPLFRRLSQCFLSLSLPPYLAPPPPPPFLPLVYLGGHKSKREKGKAPSEKWCSLPKKGRSLLFHLFFATGVFGFEEKYSINGWKREREVLISLTGGEWKECTIYVFCINSFLSAFQSPESSPSRVARDTSS